MIRVKGQLSNSVAPSSLTAPTKRKRLETSDARQKRLKLEKEPALNRVIKSRRPNSLTKRARAPLLPKPSPPLDNVSFSKRINKDSADALSKPRERENGLEAQTDHKSGQKRKAEDDAPRKAKLLKLEGNQRKPAGLHNAHRACYQNATIQCLNGIPELVEHLRSQRSRVLSNSELRAFTEADLVKLRGRSSRGGKCAAIQAAFQNSKALV